MSAERDGGTSRPSLGWILIAAVVSVALGYGLRKAVDSSAPAVRGGHPSGGAVSGSESAPERPTRLEFDLERLEGGRATAGDFSSEVLVVDFWATWCGPCRAQADILHELAEEYAEASVAFVALNVGEPMELVRDFVADTPFGYPVLLDPTERLGGRYGIYALPTVMVVDRDKTIRYQHMGISSAATLRVEIDRVLEDG